MIGPVGSPTVRDRQTSCRGDPRRGSRRDLATLEPVPASPTLPERCDSAHSLDEIAARVAALEVRVRNQPVTAATLGEVQSIGFGSRIALLVTVPPAVGETPG